MRQVDLGEFVQRLAGVRGVASPVQPRVAADGHTVRPAGAAPAGTTDALDLVPGPFGDAAYARRTGSTVLLGGESMALADVRNATNRYLAVIFPAAGLTALLGRAASEVESQHSWHLATAEARPGAVAGR